MSPQPPPGSSPTSGAARITSAMAVAGVGALAVLIGIGLWIYSGSIDQSVSFFIGGVGFIAGGLVASRLRPPRDTRS